MLTPAILTDVDASEVAAVSLLFTSRVKTNPRHFKVDPVDVTIIAAGADATSSAARA